MNFFGRTDLPDQHQQYQQQQQQPYQQPPTQVQTQQPYAEIPGQNNPVVAASSPRDIIGSSGSNQPTQIPVVGVGQVYSQPLSLGQQPYSSQQQQQQPYGQQQQLQPQSQPPPQPSTSVVSNTMMNNTMMPTTNESIQPVVESNLEVIPKLLAGDLWSNNVEIVGGSLDKLADLCFHSSVETSQQERNRTELREFGGHLAIVVVMKKWIANASIQAAGCRALQNAGVVEDPDSEAFHDLAVQVGALDTILAAMNNFPLDENVQKYGCGALLNLGWCLHNAERLVLSLKGIDAFLNAMRNFSTDVSIQRRACAFFKNLTTLSQEKFNDAIIKAGGRPLLLTAIEQHPDDNKEPNAIQGNARITLKSLL